MKTFEPGEHRSELGFFPTAEREFVFLLDLGCRVTDRKESLLTFECPNTVVRVYHATGGCDLGVEVDLIADPNRTADLAGLMIAQGLALPDQAPSETAEAIHRDLPKLARLFQEHGTSAVEGERWIFEAVHQRAQEQTARYMDPVAGERWLTQAAWDRGDREAAARHYAEIAGHLTPSEKVRLESVKK